MPNHFKYIDLTYLESVSEGDKGVIKELITIFIEQLPEFTEGFVEYFENRDWLKIAAIAHKAKSSVISLGMNSLGNKDLKNLELISKQKVLFELEENNGNSENSVDVEQIRKSFIELEEDRIEWIKENCNEEKIKELIDKFNYTCNQAINELNLVLEN